MFKLMQGSFFRNVACRCRRERRVNDLLAAIYVPFVHHQTLKRREWEAGKGWESLARKTVEDALREEIEKRFAYKIIELFT